MLQVDRLIRVKCSICSWTKIYGEEKDIPKSCPACQDGKFIIWEYNDKTGTKGKS